MSDDPIGAHLGELGRRLRFRRGRRRMLIEAEDHLRSAAAEIEASGTSPADAARQAVERFGTGITPGRSPRRAVIACALVAVAITAAAVGLRHSTGAPVSGHTRAAVNPPAPLHPNRFVRAEATCAIHLPRCTPVRLDSIAVIATAHGGFASSTLLEARAPSGVECWAPFAGTPQGELDAGSGFRCGPPPPATLMGPTRMEVFAITSGRANEIRTGGIVFVGVARPRIRRIRLVLVDGTTRTLPLSRVAYGNRSLQTFAYANTTRSDLPRQIFGLDAHGRVVYRAGFDLRAGPGPLHHT